MPKAAPRSPKKKHNRQSQRVDGGSYICPDCRRSVRNRGRGSHDNNCQARLLRIQQEAAREAEAHTADSPPRPHVDSDAEGRSPKEHHRNNPIDDSDARELASLHNERIEILALHKGEVHISDSEGEDRDQRHVQSNGSDSEMDVDEEGTFSARQRREIDLYELDGSSVHSDAGVSIYEGRGGEEEDDAVYQIELAEEWMPLSTGIARTQNSVNKSTYSWKQGDASPEKDEIRIEYHPRSGLKPEHHPFYNYEPFGLGNVNNPEHILNNSSATSSFLDKEPWRPFATHLDFDIADFMLEASLSDRQTDTMINLFRRCISEPESFTLTNSKDIRSTWDAARVVHNTSKFTKEPVEIPYPKADSDTYVKFDMWTTSLWGWCDELLSNPDIVKEFRWNAERVYKFDSETDTFERCISEPWTADAWWEAQSKIPEGGLPLSIILYADKTQLSSFGTAKAYPVMARCANLPVELRNGKGIAGGRLVGWLPVIKEDAGETGKKGFIDLKRVVWHESFKILFSTILEYAKTGITKECGDGKTRTLYPIILILSADYEEQCFMAAIRGTNSDHPCPVCLISNADLSNLEAVPVLRTSEAMQAVYNSAQQVVPEPRIGKAKAKDKFLKQYGLRDVENAFWSLRYTDVYSALSWDRLHAYHGGLFSRHLWDLFKTCVDALGKQAGKMIDLQVNQIPRWSGLNHFTSIIKTGEYTDGRKYEHMSKIIVFASHNIISRGTSEWGYILLQLIRSYLELDMFSSLLMHTEETIRRGEEEMLQFHQILQDFKHVYPDKNWNFPKMHTHTHMFDDIRRKGATRNYNTKPNENAHRPLKSYYKRTNYKDVEKQILRIHEDHLASLIINNRIANMEETELAKTNPISAGGDDSDTEDLDSLVDTHIEMGSALPLISLRKLDMDMSLPPQPQSPSRRAEHNITAPSIAEAPLDLSPAFTNIRRKVQKGLSNIISAETNKFEKVSLDLDHLIKPYRYLKVHYESVVDWERNIDHLRVNPAFHHHDRHDFVLVQTHVDRFCFAQLLYMFQITWKQKVYSLALVLPMDEPVSASHRARDRDLRFTRVVARAMTAAVVIDIRSITRGALLIRDYGSKDGPTFIVADTIDADMWWRMKSITLAQRVKFTT